MESIKNLLAALVWFLTLPRYISIGNGWIWLVVTYGAYWLALRTVNQYGDFFWGKLQRAIHRLGTWVRLNNGN